MKNKFIVFIFILMTSGFSFAASNKIRSTYDCGSSKVTVTLEAEKYSVRQTYTTQVKGKNHVVTIDSDAFTLTSLEQHFEGGDTTVDDDTQNETGLPNASLAFIGFHYPKGQMYVAAEGETNEEGYTLAFDRGLAEGAKTVMAASVFWSDWSGTNVQRMTCSRVK